MKTFREILEHVLSTLGVDFSPGESLDKHLASAAYLAILQDIQATGSGAVDAHYQILRAAILISHRRGFIPDNLSPETVAFLHENEIDLGSLEHLGWVDPTPE